MTRTRNLTLTMSVLLLCASCASGPDNKDANNSQSVNAEANKTVVSDLVSVLSQIHAPQDTTIQFIEPSSEFGRQIYARLRSAGFGLQKVSDDRGANFLEYEETEKSASKDSTQHRYSVKIGSVSAERTYEKSESGEIYPKSPIILRGTTKQASVDTTLFELQDEDLAFMSQIDYRETDSVSLRVPKATYITGDLISDIVSSSAPVLPAEMGLNASRLNTKNVYFTNESNFADLTRRYQQVSRDTIIFENDSLRLGSEGKQLIRTILNKFNAATDLITLLGCSNGYTELEMGNEGLALGRSRRVLEEITTLGVPRTSVLDEGCWAPESISGRYPSRGVVIELKRKQS